MGGGQTSRLSLGQLIGRYLTLLAAPLDLRESFEALVIASECLNASGRGGELLAGLFKP